MGIGRRAVAALTAVGLTLGLVATTAAARPQSVSADQAAVQQSLNQLRTTAGSLGAGVTYDAGQGAVSLSSGVARVNTNIPIQGGDRLRAGSISKTFTSALVLQLVDEGRVRLDAPVETYLPGKVRFPNHGADRDGRAITVRQLLQHTSGTANGTAYNTAQANVDSALQQGSLSVPGTTFSYSNSNYVLAAWIVEAVTGSSYQTVLQQKIVTPLGLQGTYSPNAGDTGIQGTHVRGYWALWTWYFDATAQDMQGFHGSGGVLSTQADLNRFYDALLSGRVVSQATLAEMKRVVPIDNPWFTGYGLGLQRFALSCGEAWGHNGAVQGYVVTTAVKDGREASVSVNSWPLFGQPSNATAEAEVDVLDAALC